MDCFDIHTHSVSSDPSQAIVSLEASTQPMKENIRYASVGIHPWYIVENETEFSLQAMKRCLQDHRVVAVGEAGLDKLKGPSLDIQTAIFRKEIALSEKHRLPLIIHCVRAFNELMQLKKVLAPRQPWIIHGFRGKASVAKELLRQECWLSFGSKYQKEAVQVVPTDRLFIETDESDESIGNVCCKIALDRGVSPEELAEAIKKNVQEVFFKH